MNRRRDSSFSPSSSPLPNGADASPLRYTECQDAVQRLNEFLSHELHDDEHTELQAHLKECEGCFAKFQFEESVLRAIRERAQQVVAPAPLRARILDLLDKEMQDTPVLA